MSGFARRLLLTLPTVLGVVTLVFFFVHLLPGDPVDVMLGETASAADRSSLRTALGLDRPIGQQYLEFVLRAATGDLGYSLRDIETITGSSVPAIKAALHRGRIRLSQLSREPEPTISLAMNSDERRLFERYVEHFNARNFNAVRDLLADEVRLELVARTRMNGKAEVSTYFGNYAATHDWHFALGTVDGRPALLARDPRTTTLEPTYFVLLRFEGDRLVDIRDFRYARYVSEGADVGRAA